MNKKSLLIVEDDPNLGQTLCEYLGTKEYSSHLVTSVAQASNFLKKTMPGIVILDIGLPDGSGLDIAKDLFQKKNKPVILFLSAQNDPDTRLQSFELGAHDYITKPFNLKELLLRLNRITEAQERIKQGPSLITLDGFQFHFSQYQIISPDSKTHNLGQKDCAILELLYRHLNQVISRDQMIDDIWGENAFPSNRTIDNYIVRLRKIIETDHGLLKIESVRGVGYKLTYKEL